MTPEKLEILLKMQKRLLVERRREAFQHDRAMMNAEIPQVVKQGIVDLGKGRYPYARFEDMDRLVRPVMGRWGFYFENTTRIVGNETIVEVYLCHREGHREKAEMKLVYDTGPGRNQMQAMGSGLSYTERYLQAMLLNVVSKGQDDDGKSAIAKLGKDHIAELRKLMAAVKVKEETFVRMFVTGVSAIEDVPARDFVRLKNALMEKKAAMK